MKKTSELKLIILVLGLIFAISIISNNNFSDDQESLNDSMKIQDEINLRTPKKSGAYTESFILIDGSHPKNWTWTAGNYSWCYYENGKYIIENVTIDASTSPTGSGIIIANSKNDYFIIRNCTVYNSGSGTLDAGIKLINTNKGTLTNNNCSNNGRNGILLYSNSDNNIISGNTANDNDNMGIFLASGCNDNTISGNNASSTISSTQYVGIYLRQGCNDNTILNNFVCKNEQGIQLYDNCYYNIISGNTANFNKVGIYLYTECSWNNISGNIVYDNTQYGIYLSDNCIESTIIENKIYNNTIYGVYLTTGCVLNLIYLNLFVGNGLHALPLPTENQWDNGYSGNYWDNYTGYDLFPVDGIGEMPYSLPNGEFDTKPLMYFLWEDPDNDDLNCLEEYSIGDDGFLTNPVDPDTDDDSFNDGVEASCNTNPLNPLWYPMPNLNVSHLSSVIADKSRSFMIDFSIRNNGIWKAEGVIVIIRCEELDLTLFNNTNSPFNLDVDDTEYINVNCPPIEQIGTYFFNITVDPDNLIAETYSNKDGSLRSDWEADNSMNASLSIISTPPPDSITYYITEDGDDDDDDDELVSTSIMTASIIIAVTGGAIATAIIIHALLMKKRIVPETTIPSKKKQPIE